MGLLDKLEQVEIKADSRLPEDDLMFCETQQQAYDESCRALREIRQQWKKAIQAQRDLLGIGRRRGWYVSRTGRTASGGRRPRRSPPRQRR